MLGRPGSSEAHEGPSVPNYPEHGLKPAADTVDSALADRGVSSLPAGSGAIAYSALCPTYGAASLQSLGLAPSVQSLGLAPSVQSLGLAPYDHLAAKPHGAVYAVPGALTATGPRGQAVYEVTDNGLSASASDA